MTETQQSAIVVVNFGAHPYLQDLAVASVSKREQAINALSESQGSLVSPEDRLMVLGAASLLSAKGFANIPQPVVDLMYGVVGELRFLPTTEQVDAGERS